MADLEESDYTYESSEYSSEYSSYSSSQSDYDLPAGGALPPSESALSTNLHEHIILRISLKRKSLTFKFQVQSLQSVECNNY